MFRKITLSVLLLVGILCLAVGESLQRVQAGVSCQDQEPDAGIYCPVQVGDWPNATCATAGNDTQEKCEGADASYASGFTLNFSYPKHSPGFYPELQFDSIFQPATFPCYLRTRCTWDMDANKCKEGTSEWVNKFLYFKKACP